MHITAFAGCCTAKIITGFGQEVTADIKYSPRGSYHKEEMEANLRRYIEDQKYDMAAVVATFTQNQTNFRRLAKHYGFVISDPMKKRQHSDNVLYLAYLPLNNYQLPERLFVDKPKALRPRDARGRFIKANPFNKGAK